jgi:hypothetical protein
MTVDRSKLSEHHLIHLEKADEISPTFCSAKWHMVTLHLAQGETHSCYHPWTHKVPLEEVEKDPGAIHNTEFKKSQRKLMLKGERPKECEYCWRMEDLGNISDRIIRNAENFAKDDLDIFKEYTGDENVYPRHVEVSFSTTCNLKCSYCNPTVSSKWLEEVKQYGGYKTSTDFNGYIKPNKPLPFILDREHNPYVEAFWKWLPDAYPHMHVLRVTGGEPLMSKHTFTLLDYIAEHPNKKLEVVVNSNMCVPDKLIDQAIEAGKGMVDKVGVFKMFASLDATGIQAEYGRTGLDYEQFKTNVRRFLDEVPGCRVSFTCTFNVFSVPGVKQFMEYMNELRTDYPGRISFDTPYLRYPPHQCIQILPNEYTRFLDEAAEYMKQADFPKLTIDKIYRLKDYMTNKTFTQEEIETYRRDFVIFVDEHDKRRGTNFLEAFPEFEEFYKLCQNT